MADVDMAHLQSSAQLAETIEGSILNGQIVPGSKLPSERELCRQYGVSRSVVREALRGVEERGHITIRPSRGAYVRRASGTDLSKPLTRLIQRVGATMADVVAARAILESAAAELATTVASDGTIGEIENLLHRHESAATTPDRVETDLAFHKAIVAATGNSLLVIMYGSIEDFVVRMMRRSHMDPSVHDKGDPLHAEIFTYMRNRDAEGARRTMHTHVTLAYQLYGSDIDKNVNDVL